MVAYESVHNDTPNTVEMWFAGMDKNACLLLPSKRAGWKIPLSILHDVCVKYTHTNSFSITCKELWSSSLDGKRMTVNVSDIISQDIRAKVDWQDTQRYPPWTTKRVCSEDGFYDMSNETSVVKKTQAPDIRKALLQNAIGKGTFSLPPFFSDLDVTGKAQIFADLIGRGTQPSDIIAALPQDFLQSELQREIDRKEGQAKSQAAAKAESIYAIHAKAKEQAAAQAKAARGATSTSIDVPGPLHAPCSLHGDLLRRIESLSNNVKSLAALKAEVDELKEMQKTQDKVESLATLKGKFGEVQTLMKTRSNVNYEKNETTEIAKDVMTKLDKQAERLANLSKKLHAEAEATQAGRKSKRDRFLSEIDKITGDIDSEQFKEYLLSSGLSSQQVHMILVGSGSDGTNMADQKTFPRQETLPDQSKLLARGRYEVFQDRFGLPPESSKSSSTKQSPVASIVLSGRAKAMPPWNSPDVQYTELNTKQEGGLFALVSFIFALIGFKKLRSFAMNRLQEPLLRIRQSQ